MTPSPSLALLVLIGLLGGAPALARQAAPEPPDPNVALAQTARGFDQILGTWRLRGQALEDGDEERAAEHFQSVVRLAREAGVRRLDAIGVALLREARKAAADGAFDRARARLDQAAVIAAGLPEIRDVEADVALAQQGLAVHRWAQQKIKGLGDRVADFQRRMLLLSDGVLTALLLFAAFAAIFLTSQAIRYGLHIYHDLGQAFPVVMKFVLLAAGGLLLMVPLLYGFGPILFLFPLVILLWSYQRWPERVLSVALTLGLGVAPWALRMGDRLSEAGTGLTDALHGLSLNPTEAPALARVEAAVLADPADWHARAVLGLAYKRLGRLDEAERQLSAATRLSPPDDVAGAIHNNLGNVHFAAGRAGLAEAAYQKAREMAPQAPEPPFNLSRLYNRTGRQALAATTLQEAAALAAERVAGWSEDDDANLNRHVADMDLAPEVLTRRALAEVFAPTPLALRAWVVLAGPVPEMAAPIGAGLTILLFAILQIVRRRMQLTWPCSRCGRPAPVALVQGRPGNPLCEHCDNLFVKNVPVDRRIRFQKEEAIARYASLRRWGIRVSGALLPGLASLIRGRVLSGSAFVLATLLLGLWLWRPEGVLVEPVRLPDDGAAGRWVMVAGLVLLWAASTMGAIRASRERG